MHSTYSCILSRGFENFIPCHFSTIASVLTPNPITVLLFESRSSVVAAIATVAGVLANVLTTDVPILTRLVICEMAPKLANASRPHDSGTHKESTFLHLSASFENDRTSSIDSRLPGLYPILPDSITLWPRTLFPSLHLQCLCENLWIARTS